MQCLESAFKCMISFDSPNNPEMSYINLKDKDFKV